ncbi:MAG: putative DNA binding domain-containing protein [Kiritimatiellae bacterium]|nr:putative DNA binding domain-containing protein [Kiritimatiellia bacterium]
MENILQRIRLGEDSALELKRVATTSKRVSEPDSRDMADEFAAAANAQGTTFLLGVCDKSREILGIAPDKLDLVETWVRDICNDSVKPPIQAMIRKLQLPDSHGVEKCVLRVDVPKSLFVHKGPHGYFYRIGSSKREMSPEQLARLFQQRSQTRLVCFDEQTVPTAKLSDLDPGLFARFRTPLSPLADNEFLRKLHFIAPDADGTWRPTVGGILMSCPRPEEFLPSAYIQAVCYRGTERNANDQLDARDIMGPLDRQIFEACRFVSRNMRVAAIKSPARIDIQQYAMNAVFEAVTNAVAHRDYSVSGAKIRIHMFADRLEIMSPGGLPNSMAVEEIGERQFARNELVCTCLSRCPLEERFADVDRSRIMDRRGEGVPVIVSASERQSGIIPKYRLSGEAELKLTIFAAPIDNRAALSKIAQNLSRGEVGTLQTLTDGVDRLRSLIRDNPKVTQAEMAKACGVSRTTINNWIRKSNGAIRRIGFDNGGHWVVQPME